MKKSFVKAHDGEVRPVGFLHLSMWFGLVTGLGEVLIRGVQKFILHERIFLSPNVVWMAPLADISLFVIIGVILLLGCKFWPRVGSPRVGVFVFVFFGLLGPLLFVPRLHHYAAIALAAGLAVQSARFITAHGQRFNVLVRRSIAGMVALVVGMALVVQGWQTIKVREAIAKLPPAPSRAPNVLLVVLDTVRAKSLSLYGYDRPTTPRLEGFAKTGVVFERALSTSPWTLPSHASMFTGRYPHELSADWLTPLDDSYPTLAEVFSERGYMTAAFVANLLYCTYETGLNRGFAHYEDFPVSPGMIIKSSWLTRIIADLWLTPGKRQELVRKSAEEVNHDFFQWLSEKDDRPFFAFLNYFDAHAPYISPKPFDERFGPSIPRPDVKVQRHWTPEEIQVDLNAYDGTIAYVDNQLGSLLDTMQERGLLENTVIIITSDHGEQFGEHGLFDHANSLYRPLLHVPLVISFPRDVPRGARVREPVTLRDLPATVMDLVGLRDKHLFPGNSLARYWRGTKASRTSVEPLLAEVNKAINLGPWQPVSQGNMKLLLTDGLYYVRNGDGSEELYDFESDPHEERDLANSGEGRREIARLRLTLDMILSRKHQDVSLLPDELFKDGRRN